MQCSASHSNNQDDVRYLEEKGLLGEAVCQAHRLTKPKKSFSPSGGGSFWEILTTEQQFRYSLPQ